MAPSAGACPQAGRPFIVLASPPRHEEERWRLVTEMEDRPHVGIEGRTLGSWLKVSSMVYLEWGERARAEAQLEEAGRVARRTGDAELLVRTLETPIILASLDGRLEEALSGVEGVKVRADDVELPAGLYAGLLGYRPLLHLGRAEDAIAAVDEAGGLSQPTFLLLMSVLARAHLGPPDEAEDSLRRLLAEHPFLLEDENVPTFMLVELLETASCARSWRSGWRPCPF